MRLCILCLIVDACMIILQEFYVISHTKPSTVTIKVKCCTSRANPQLWSHQRYWLMVKLLLYLKINSTFETYNFVQNIVKTLSWPPRRTSGNILTCFNFGQLSSFSWQGQSFYGSPLWYLNGTAVQ